MYGNIPWLEPCFIPERTEIRLNRPNLTSENGEVVQTSPFVCFVSILPNAGIATQLESNSVCRSFLCERLIFYDRFLGASSARRARFRLENAYLCSLPKARVDGPSGKISQLVPATHRNAGREEEINWKRQTRVPMAVVSLLARKMFM